MTSIKWNGMTNREEKRERKLTNKQRKMEETMVIRLNKAFNVKKLERVK